MLPHSGERADDTVAVKNAADKTQVRTARKQKRFADQQEARDFAAVLETQEGRRTAWRILEWCRTFESVFDYNSHKMAFHSGQQDIGHRLLASVQQHHPDALLTMMRQRYDLEQAAKAATPESHG